MSRSIQNLWHRKRFSVNYIPTDPTDPASLVMLSRELELQDDTRYTDAKMLCLRDLWMSEQEKKLGKNGLFCKICGKGPLSPWITDKRHLATLDHIVPIAKNNHGWNDESNFQIACYACNNKKKDTI